MVLYATDQGVAAAGRQRQPFSTEGVTALLDHPDEASAATAVLAFRQRVFGVFNPAIGSVDLEWTSWAFALVACVFGISFAAGWALEAFAKGREP